MKRLLLILASTFPFYSSANDTLVESIERFTDIFSVSLSQNPDNEKTVATLDINYQINDKLRVFGEVDTQEYWQAGVGYSFWQGNTYYTENTVKVSEHEITTGIFAAKLIHEQWTLIGDINYNYMDRDFDACLPNLCLEYKVSDTFDYSVGALWSPIKYADFLYKFNQEIGFKKDTQDFYINDDITSDSGHIRNEARTNIQYHEVAIFFNLKYIKPSVTYTLRPEADNYVEFGLSFDF
ncbi:hypothetical protein AB4391_04730 [Vibrio lentus]|uniref:Porin n=1 Tax=Vibrio lentus TaxID=136468 RepID=A0A2N7JXN4_9VIBR|nr:hypothetical protein [Vibrio lentus]PMM65058.1 hypothetical protein BCT49_15255 [Vibrio lentus]